MELSIRTSTSSCSKNKCRLSLAWVGVLTSLVGCANLSLKSLPFRAGGNDVEAKMAYARLCERHGQSAQAAALYKSITDQDHRQQLAYQRLGVMAAKQGDFAEAEAHFKHAMKIATPTPDLYNDLGYCYYLQDRMDEASASYQQALKLNPHYKAAANNLGLVQGEQGHYEEALATFRKAGSEADAYSNLGYVLARNHDLAKAQQYYSRALDLNPDSKPAAEGLLQVAGVRTQPVQRDYPMVARKTPGAEATATADKSAKVDQQAKADQLAKDEVAGDQAENQQTSAKGASSAGKTADSIARSQAQRGKVAAQSKQAKAAEDALGIEVTDMPRRPRSAGKRPAKAVEQDEAESPPEVAEGPHSKKPSKPLSKMVTKSAPTSKSPSTVGTKSKAAVSAIRPLPDAKQTVAMARPKTSAQRWLDLRTRRWLYVSKTNTPARQRAASIASRQPAVVPAATVAAERQTIPTADAAPRTVGNVLRKGSSSLSVAVSQTTAEEPPQHPLQASPGNVASQLMSLSAKVDIATDRELPSLPQAGMKSPLIKPSLPRMDQPARITVVERENRAKIDVVSAESNPAAERPRASTHSPSAELVSGIEPAGPATPARIQPAQPARPMGSLPPLPRPTTGATSQGVKPTTSQIPTNEPSTDVTRTSYMSSLQEASAVDMTVPAETAAGATVDPAHSTSARTAPSPATPAPPAKTAAQIVREADELAAAQKLAEAVQVYGEALRMMPSEQHALAGRAKVLYALEQFEAALVDASALVAATPDDANAWCLRGQILMSIGQYPLAVQDFSKTLSLDPSNLEAHLGRARLRVRSSQPQAAQADFDEAIRLAPGQAQTYFERARLFRVLGRKDAAIEDYTVAIRLDESTNTALLERALTYLELGQANLAQRDLNAGIEHWPGDARLYLGRSRVYRSQGNYADALDDLETAARLDPQDQRVARERAAMLAEQQSAGR